MLHVTPYPELNAVLARFLEESQSILKDNLIGLYLNGSFALGGSDEHSDVDFIAVTHDDVTSDQEAKLQTMHGEIYDLETTWAQHLEGSYIPSDLLRRADPAQTPLLYLDNTARVLVRDPHCNTLVVRWTTREHGIALFGPDPKALIDPVAPDDLQLEARSVLNRWQREIRADPGMIENRWLQAYAVVSHCRILYTLRHGTIASKPDAVRWALGVLEKRWAGLIERAWADRPNPSLKSKLNADPSEASRTLEFVRYALEVASRLEAAQI